MNTGLCQLFHYKRGQIHRNFLFQRVSSWNLQGMSFISIFFVWDPKKKSSSLPDLSRSEILKYCGFLNFWSENVVLRSTTWLKLCLNEKFDKYKLCCKILVRYNQFYRYFGDQIFAEISDLGILCFFILQKLSERA